MFNVNYKNLRLSFNDFHEFTDKDMRSTENTVCSN